LYTITGLGGYLAARIMQGVSTAFFSMALQIGIIEALPEEDRSQGISLYSLFSYIPGILGPILALGIWQTGDMNYFTVMMIAIALTTGLVGYSAKMDKENGQSVPTPDGQGANSFKSLSQLVKNPVLFKCSILMLVASIVFGAITTFIPLYAKQLENGNAGIYLMLMAGTVVFSRFTLRKKIPSDGKWHPSFMMRTMFLLAVGVLCVSFSTTGGFMLFYLGAIFIGVAQAIIYPTLTTYLTFVLPQSNRNVLIGLFIAMADLGVSLGSLLMGPIADLVSYSNMYLICSFLSLSMVFFSIGQQKLSVK
jgi:MFS family permease